MTPYDPARDVVSLMIAGDYHSADTVVAKWVDSGHADLLIDSLLDHLLSLLEDVAERTTLSAPELWSQICVQIELDETET